jgi:hypothetical protein
MLLAVISLVPLHGAMADETSNAAAIMNEYLSAAVTCVCVEKSDPDLRECNIPMDKCRRFVILVAKHCLGEQIALRKPMKHPTKMKEEELLGVLDKAAICTGRMASVVTYYLCPEQHERRWAGTGDYKYKKYK